MSKLPEIRLPRPVSLAEIIGIDPHKHPFLQIPEAGYQTLEMIRHWCITRCIWPESDEQGDASNSMIVYFHPELMQLTELLPWFQGEFSTHPDAASYRERLQLAGNYYSWLYFLDDTLANDIQQGMTEENKKVVESALKIVFGFLLGKIDFAACLDNLSVFHDTAPPQTREFIAKIAYGIDAFDQLMKQMYYAVMADAELHPEDGNLPLEWFEDMQNNLKAHLLQALTNQDKNLSQNGTDYMVRRREVSGMTFATHLSQFVYRCYLPKDSNPNATLLQVPNTPTTGKNQITHPFLKDTFEQLYPSFSQAPSIDEALHRLATLSEDYGGVGNDLVSVIKELRENSLFNLVALVWGNTKENDPDTLLEAISQVGLLNTQIFNHAEELKNEVLAAISAQPDYDPYLARKQSVLAVAYYYICLATYYWQTSPEARPRYGEHAKNLYQEFATS